MTLVMYSTLSHLHSSVLIFTVRMKKPLHIMRQTHINCLRTENELQPSLTLTSMIVRGINEKLAIEMFQIKAIVRVLTSRAIVMHKELKQVMYVQFKFGNYQGHPLSAMIPPRTFCDRGSGSSVDLCHKCSFVDLPSVRGGSYRVDFGNSLWNFLDLGGWFCVEKVRKFFGYIPFKEK